MTILRLQPYEVQIWGDRKDRPLARMQVSAYSQDEAKADALARFSSDCRLENPSGRLPKVVRVDVLDGVRVTPTQRQQGLFEDLAEVCLGESMENIQGAAVNLLLTCVQRRYVKLADAEARWNELAGRSLEALRRRYTGNTDIRDRSVETEIAQRLMS